MEVGTLISLIALSLSAIMVLVSLFTLTRNSHDAEAKMIANYENIQETLLDIKEEQKMFTEIRISTEVLKSSMETIKEDITTIKKDTPLWKKDKPQIIGRLYALEVVNGLKENGSVVLNKDELMME